MSATTYRVTGMTCGGCANSVTKAIQTAAPGVEVSVDLDAKTVTVDGDADERAVAQAVADAGFEFEGKAA
jgi:copper chaperone